MSVTFISRAGVPYIHSSIVSSSILSESIMTNSANSSWSRSEERNEGCLCPMKMGYPLTMTSSGDSGLFPIGDGGFDSDDPKPEIRGEGGSDSPNILESIIKSSSSSLIWGLGRGLGGFGGKGLGGFDLPKRSESMEGLGGVLHLCSNPSSLTISLPTSGLLHS